MKCRPSTGNSISIAEGLFLKKSNIYEAESNSSQWNSNPRPPNYIPNVPTTKLWELNIFQHIDLDTGSGADILLRHEMPTMHSKSIHCQLLKICSWNDQMLSYVRACTNICRCIILYIDTFSYRLGQRPNVSQCNIDFTIPRPFNRNI